MKDNIMNGLPQNETWRRVLAWGCVVIFLAAPPLIFGLHMLGFLTGIDKDLDYLSRWYFAITGVLVSLAGLNTIQQVKNGRQLSSLDKEWTPKPPRPIETTSRKEPMHE
jgi:hypothetical protein